MIIRRDYERKVAEVFGYPPEASSPQALRVRREYECPFLVPDVSSQASIAILILTSLSELVVFGTVE
jgi:hypothetical protein